MCVVWLVSYLHVAHGDEAVDLGDAQPVQGVGHQGLEADTTTDTGTHIEKD